MVWSLATSRRGPVSAMMALRDQSHLHRDGNWTSPRCAQDAPTYHHSISAHPMSYIRRSTIDQHRGEESPGLHHFALTDIVTDLSGWAECHYEDLTLEDQEWWDTVLDDVHAAELAIGLLDADERHAVEDALLEGDECREAGDLAAQLRYTMTDVLAGLHG